jgi:spermidine synthase
LKRPTHRVLTGSQPSDKMRAYSPNSLLSWFYLEDPPRTRILWPLFLVSFACLYLEVLLIRWIGTEVRVFAYFQNLALLACFLGFGIGCYQAKFKKTSLFEPLTMGILIIFVGLPFAPWKSILESLSSVLSLSPDAQIWAGVIKNDPRPHYLFGLFIVSVLVISSFLILMVATMVPLGQWVGTYLDAARNPVTAYSVNLIGSLAGIWLFAAMSFLRLGPIIWFGFAFLLFLLIHRPVHKAANFGAFLLGGSLLLLLHAAGGNEEIYWSPYQKVEIRPAIDQQFNLLVNNSGYMTIANASPAYLEMHPALATAYQDSSYDSPFRFVDRRDRVLIIGAGAGNDAAAALRNGAGYVDAVEIDPVIYSLGRRLHPDQPYSSPRVHVILTDARAYLRQSTQRYDLVVFGLLDSQTQFSGYSNMRIDNYVYTKESFQDVKRLLKPSGVLIVKFEVHAPWTWMGQRFYSMFNELFGRPPLVFYAPPTGAMLGATEFLASNDSSVWDRATRPELAEIFRRFPPRFPPDLSQAPPSTTDDWPYVYNRGHSIPRTYLTVSLILLIMAFLMTRRALQPVKASTWCFFFLGAGFLLLETQLISRLALYFGSTWWVNCIALSAVLLVLVLSNICVEHGAADRLFSWYLASIVSLLVIYFIPWQSLPFQTISLGTLLAGAYCVPVFFAGVIFAETFRRAENKSSAFGSNILGAVAGGLAQNISFVIGLKALLLLAAGFYALAGIFNAIEKGSAARSETLLSPSASADT